MLTCMQIGRRGLGDFFVLCLIQYVYCEKGHFSVDFVEVIGKKKTGLVSSNALGIWSCSRLNTHFLGKLFDFLNVNFGCGYCCDFSFKFLLG